jgi:TRAP-type C4-dicarboxylate transport system substrate-binding protein
MFLKGKGILFLSLWMFLASTHSTSAQTINIATVAVKDTGWAIQLKEMAKEINLWAGTMKFKIIYSGMAGDESEVLEKIKKGELDGAIFTGKTLGDINGDVRVLEIPFTFFNDIHKANTTLKKMIPFFNDGFDEKGFKALGYFNLGMIYYVTTKKTEELQDLKGQRVWSWKGDMLVSTMLQTMTLPEVPLALGEVSAAFESGLIDAAYGPTHGILGLEWHKKIKYLVDAPVAYSVGAFLMSKKGWDKLSDGDKKVIERFSWKFTDQISTTLNNDSQESYKMMQFFNIKYVRFSEESLNKLRGLRKKIIAKLKGKLFSEEALNKLETHLN